MQFGRTEFHDGVVHFRSELLEAGSFGGGHENHPDPISLETEGFQHILDILHQFLCVKVSFIEIAFSNVSSANNHAIGALIERPHDHIG